MWRINSLENTLLLENIESRRRREQQRMRWLDDITNSMNMGMSKLLEIVKDRETGVLQPSLVQSLSHVQLFATPWIAARQAFLSITNSWSLHKLMSNELVMSSNHLILCHPLLLLPSLLPNSWVFSDESALCIRWLQLQHQSFQRIFTVDFL